MQPPDSSLWMLVWRVGRVFAPYGSKSTVRRRTPLGKLCPVSLVQAKSQGGSPGQGYAASAHTVPRVGRLLCVLLQEKTKEEGDEKWDPPRVLSLQS